MCNRATLASFYDPDLMPPNLRAAHSAIDRAVDRHHRPAGFASDRERVEHLFALFEAMTAPSLPNPPESAANRRVRIHGAPRRAPDSPPCLNAVSTSPNHLNVETQARRKEDAGKTTLFPRRSAN